MASIGTTSLVFGVLFFFAIGACEARVPREVAFVRTRGSHFVLHGSPFLFNGFNAYWMMNVASDPNERHKVSDVFREASASGLTICRTWAFSDGGDRALQISPGTYDERVFQGLDFVISEAKKYGIRLILSFVNNYNDFGGRPQYAQWARSAGLQVNSDDDFYTHMVLKDYYKNHIKRIVTRLNTITRIAYKDDPTIMAWELINEPRCQIDYSGRTVNGWVQEMASFVKSLDRKHLTPCLKGSKSIPVTKLEQISLVTTLLERSISLTGKSEEEQMGFMERWMSNHWDDSRTILKKPLVIAEFGKSSKDPGFSINERDLYIGNVYRDIYKFARTGGTMSGSLVWQLMAQGMDSYYDGYQIVLSQNLSTAGIISRQSHDMNALSHIITCEARVPRELAFVRTRGSHFVLHGSPFLFNGFNAYWMMKVASDPNERYKVSDVFREASAAGLTVCRTWAFSDGGDRALQISPGTYDERVFQGLDFVISEAKKYGIRLILSFVNNYNDFGGRPQYAQWAKNAGVQVNGDDDFYTHPVLKDYYKNHIKRVVTRFNTITRFVYKDDPTIMAWELMNEPRCQVDYSGRTINGWVQEMASFVKSLDRKHLVEVGMEGFYGDTMPERKQVNPGYQVGTDFISNNLIREIDFVNREK
ncbi:hypothetical protein ACJIZ3_003121 [Penstemon smallii]|uniref:mannan endo-1,4-beta-mannosidase n=1 Tax=Penstemon smallii TaxID=265156 RepID=A0ABD3UC42_9LAMI